MFDLSDALRRARLQSVPVYLRADNEALTPVKEDAQTGADGTGPRLFVPVLLSVMALSHPVPVLKQIAAGLLPSPRLREGLHGGVAVRASIHQQLRRNHPCNKNAAPSIGVETVWSFF